MSPAGMTRKGSEVRVLYGPPRHVNLGTQRGSSDLSGELPSDEGPPKSRRRCFRLVVSQKSNKRETSFVRLGTKAHTAYATAVADVEHHHIIDILPPRTFTDVVAWLDIQPTGWKERSVGASSRGSRWHSRPPSVCGAPRWPGRGDERAGRGGPHR